jgi:hypothetical protein
VEYEAEGNISGSMRAAIPGRRLAVGVVIAGLMAACSSQGSGDADVSAQAEDALPRDLALSFVTAGDEAGWVAGVGGGQTVDRLWRLTPDGAATEVAELPDLQSMGSAALDDDRVAIAGIRCVGGEGDSAEACGAWGIDVLVMNAAGETTRVALFEEETPLGDGDGLRIAGSTGDSVWVSTKRGLFEVSADGAVVQDLPAARGGECVIDGALYRIVGPEPATDSSQGSSPPVTTGNPGQQAADRRPIEIQRLDGETFAPVPGSIRELNGEAHAMLRCTDSAVEAARFNGALTDRWTPTQGWQAPRGVPAPAMASLTTGLGRVRVEPRRHGPRTRTRRGIQPRRHPATRTW